MNILKRFTILLCPFLFSALLTVAVVASVPVESDDFGLFINGDEVIFDENVPIKVGGRTLLPLRFVFDQLNGGDLAWDDSQRMATLRRGETEVKLWIDNNSAQINGAEVKLDAAPILYNNSTYVPLRFIADSLDMSVYWDAGSATAFIADNTLLDKIIALSKESDSRDGISTMAMDITMDMEAQVFVEGAARALTEYALWAEGIIMEEYENEFSYSGLRIISSDGVHSIVEIYDDGSYQYSVVDGYVMKDVSAFDPSANKYSVISGIEIDRIYYAGLKYEEDDEFFYIYGMLFMPDDIVSEILSRLELLNNVFDKDGGIEIKFISPIVLDTAIDRETKRQVSVYTEYEIEMKLVAQGLTMHIIYVIDIPWIEYDVEFDPVVPEEIIEAALEI